MTALDTAKAFAKREGYDSVERICSWRDYEVFDFFNAKEIDADVGLPSFIFVSDRGARFSDVDEAFSVIDALPE